MIITKTPLRISLLGGNTDFPKYFYKHGGAVLTTTIDKYVYCIIKERFDDEIWINYSIKEKVKKIESIKHDIVRECLKYLKVEKGIEITFLSDIPSQGTGMGSSSAVAVGLLNALHAYKGESVPEGQLAWEACNIEINILKKPIGIQDQLAVAYGGCKMFKFKDQLETMKLSDHFRIMFKDTLMLFYTGKTRKADKILKKMKLNKRILDRNKKLVAMGVRVMAHYDIYGFATLLDEYWQLKKMLNKKVTNSKIDRMYKLAKNAGALGGKIVGAGGGGFLLLVVPHKKQRAVRQALALRELPFKGTYYGSRVIFNSYE